MPRLSVDAMRKRAVQNGQQTDAVQHGQQKKLTTGRGTRYRRIFANHPLCDGAGTEAVPTNIVTNYQ
jgi:hypothetical protein